MSGNTFIHEPGKPPQVDDQGSLETCTRFALSKAVVDGFDKQIWVKSESVDIEQDAVTSILLNEHKDGEGKWPTDFNGKVYQFQDSKKDYWSTKLEVKWIHQQDLSDINAPNPKYTYVLVYEIPFVAPNNTVQFYRHCVYITKYDANTNTLVCMNSYGSSNDPVPVIPKDQKGNIIYKIECEATKMKPPNSFNQVATPVGLAKESGQVKQRSSGLTTKKKKDAESVIGSKCFHQLLEAANNGEISDGTMVDLAKKMEPRVYGEYKKQSVIKNIDMKAVLKSMLDKWFDVFLFKLNDGEGQAILLGILDGMDNDEMTKLACEMRTSLKHQEK